MYYYADNTKVCRIEIQPMCFNDEISYGQYYTDFNNIVHMNILQQKI